MRDGGRIERHHKNDHGGRHDHQLGDDAALVSRARPSFAVLFIS